MSKLVFSARDPAESTITDAATGAVLYKCSKSGGSITVRDPCERVVGMYDGSSFTAKVALRGRVQNLKEFLPRKGVLTEYVLLSSYVVDYSRHCCSQRKILARTGRDRVRMEKETKRVRREYSSVASRQKHS